MPRPGHNHNFMIFVYDFEPSAAAIVSQVATSYCFHIALPARAGDTTFRYVRISANTPSFSQLENPFPRGYFHTDPKDRVIAVDAGHMGDDSYTSPHAPSSPRLCHSMTFGDFASTRATSSSLTSTWKLTADQASSTFCSAGVRTLD